MEKIKPILTIKYASITCVAIVALYILATSGFVISAYNNNSMILRLLSVLLFLLTALYYTHESKTVWVKYPRDKIYGAIIF